MPCLRAQAVEKSTGDASQIMQARHTVCNRNREKRPNGLVAPCEPPRPARRLNWSLSMSARNQTPHCIDRCHTAHLTRDETVSAGFDTIVSRLSR
jgi:hypothetical protein